MNKFSVHEWINTALIVVVGILVLVGVNQSGSSALELGGSRFPNGISADSTSPVAGEIRGADLTLTDDGVITDDLTVNGRTFTLTTSNAATSTAVLGCVQTYATSTDTAVRFGIGTVATTSPLSSGGNSIGFVLWQYGSCPI